MNSQPKPIVSLVPPFTRETAILKVRAVEDNWNTRDPERAARGYALDCYCATARSLSTGETR
jgi:nuclear transport factor 2 (NTF2) superfamily protein